MIFYVILKIITSIHIQYNRNFINVIGFEVGSEWVQSGFRVGRIQFEPQRTQNTEVAILSHQQNEGFKIFIFVICIPCTCWFKLI